MDHIDIIVCISTGSRSSADEVATTTLRDVAKVGYNIIIFKVEI